MARSAALRQTPAQVRSPKLADWYERPRVGPPLVPAVKLGAGCAVVCPFCHDGVHVHERDGIHNPGCNGPRAQYDVRTMPPAEFVRLMLQRLGFAPEQVDEIIAAIAAGEDNTPPLRV